jgi:hypothetical protein
MGVCVCVCDVACNKVQSLPFWVDVYFGSRQGGRLSSQITAVAGKKNNKREKSVLIRDQSIIEPTAHKAQQSSSTKVAPTQSGIVRARRRQSTQQTLLFGKR